MNTIDQKIEQLTKLTDNFLFIEYYTHTGCDMYKILCEYTKYKELKFPLFPISEGFEKSLDKAILLIENEKNEFFK